MSEKNAIDAIPVTAAVAIHDGKVLLTRRAVGQKLAGCWEFPGGKVEQNENLSTCIQRELEEELGVGSTVIGEFHRSVFEYGEGAIELIGLEVGLHSGDFVLTVHDRAEWVAISQLLNFQLAPADVAMAQEIVRVYGS